jgi:mitogen-activated protein kinase kinase
LSDLEEDYANSLDLGDGTPTYNTFASKKKKEHRRLSRQKTVDKQGEVASLSIIELMHQIVSEPPPRLGSQYGEEAQEFVDACLAKDPDERHTPRTLLVCVIAFLSHPNVLIVSS